MNRGFFKMDSETDDALNRLKNSLHFNEGHLRLSLKNVHFADTYFLMRAASFIFVV